MSSITEEEALARIMRPGFKVVRGKDWEKCCKKYKYKMDEDGNGEGTITQILSCEGSCNVKWDHNGFNRWYAQGFNGLFSLKLAEQKPHESKNIFL